MNRNNQYQDRDWLYQQYVVELRSTLSIASECSAPTTSVRNALIQHGIPRRDGKEAQVYRIRKLPRARLVTLIAQEFSPVMIAAETGLSYNTVRVRMTEEGLQFENRRKKGSCSV